ncbi:hypothetical protein Gotur_023853 [Gossypium turneri]
MKRLVVGSMMTPEYGEWRSKRINDNISELNSEDFERKIERLEEEKMHLRLDADVQKLEVEKLRKRKNKIDEDLDSLKRITRSYDYR